MGNKMSKKSRKELASQIQPRYLNAGKLEKKILLEFIENAGYNRKSAIRLMHSDLHPKTYKKGPVPKDVLNHTYIFQRIEPCWGTTRALFDVQFITVVMFVMGVFQ